MQVEAHLRRAAIEGRLLVLPPRHPSSKQRKDDKAEQLPGVSYRLLAPDADAQARPVAAPCSHGHLVLTSP